MFLVNFFPGIYLKMMCLYIFTDCGACNTCFCHSKSNKWKVEQEYNFATHQDTKCKSFHIHKWFALSLSSFVWLLQGKTCDCCSLPSLIKVGIQLHSACSFCNFYFSWTQTWDIHIVEIGEVCVGYLFTVLQALFGLTQVACFIRVHVP